MTIVRHIKCGSALAILIFSLSACSWLKQPAAPVESSYPDANAPTNPGANQSGDYGNPPPTSYPDYGNTPAPSGNTGYTPSNAPVDSSATYHTVVSGDTLYNISKRYGVSQADILAWNNMPDPTVKLGTRLRVKGGGGTQVATGTSTPPTTTSTTPTSTSTGPNTAGGISWVVPTSGSVISRYNSTTKGVDIAGTMGQPVNAAAAGKVVYSGNGLKAFGNLVIIQHNQTYLSAYAHNKTILVKEGQSVTRGQKIAEMGNSGTDRVKLHFEIRKQGQPVDPTQFVKL